MASVLVALKTVHSEVVAAEKVAASGLTQRALVFVKQPSSLCPS